VAKFREHQPKDVEKSVDGKKEKAQQSAVAEIGDRLPTVNIGRKVRGCCAPFGEARAGQWVPI